VANLTITLNARFTTTTLQVHDDKKFEEVFLNPKKSSDLFNKVSKTEISFEVVSTNEDAEASFPFFAKNGTHGSKFEVTVQSDGSLSANIEGEFTVAMRQGADKSLKKLASKLDLRVRGIMWKGGAYNGFMAWVKDGDFEQNSTSWYETFPKIETFSIK